MYRSHKDALAAGVFTADPAEYFDPNVCAVSHLVDTTGGDPYEDQQTFLNATANGGTGAA